jgi:hypothetical protein
LELLSLIAKGQSSKTKDLIERFQKIIQVSTVAGIISGKNNEPTTVVMNCTFMPVKDGLGSASRRDDLF